MHDHSKKILSLIDLTSLNDTDNEEVIAALCKKAITHGEHVAAVCVYPQFVKQAAETFSGKPVKIATVANFPGASSSVDTVVESIATSIRNGANEIDVVFPYMQYLAGDKTGAYDLIRACRHACGKNVLLKVILETGVLKEAAVITDVSRHVLLAGADFLKTSTGKISIGATPEAAKAMLLVIKEKSAKLKRSFGFKASGGVRTVEQAEQYISLAEEIMGAEWVKPENFRLGASQLVDALVAG